jgi:DNA polymerase (family 10)
MTVTNPEIAALLHRYGILLEIQGANSFRVRAYRNAARTIQELPHSVAAMLDEGADLSQLPAIGHDLAKKIEAIVATGRLTQLEELEKEIPGALADLTEVPGLGPKHVAKLFHELDIDSIEDLRAAAQAGKIRAIPGFGAKTEQKILKEVVRLARTSERFGLFAVEQMAESLVAWLEQFDGVKAVTIAGSYRRRRETVGDLDILVTARRGTKVMDRFVAYDDVAEVVSKGSTRCTVRLRSGLQVDLRLVPQVSYGAALHYFTGSKAHNIATRKLALAKGLKLNEYGVFRGSRRIAGRSEREVYATVDLPWITPELREDRGEIEAAARDRLPRLVAVADIRGDLHCHTRASDGRNTIREMAEAARGRGYDYLAISDHTRRVTVAHGLDERRLKTQIEDIDAINDELDGIRLLKSAEVDILEDGSLDMPDRILADLDLIVCAVHSAFGLSREKQTERIIRAMDNRHFNILAHPSGRLLGEREPVDVDMERLIGAALERRCYMEINAQPERLDLSDIHARMAKDMGLKIAVSTDAHSTATLDYMRFGVDQARRAWLGPGDVLNTRSWTALRKLLNRR